MAIKQSDMFILRYGFITLLACTSLYGWAQTSHPAIDFDQYVYEQIDQYEDQLLNNNSARLFDQVAHNTNSAIKLLKAKADYESLNDTLTLSGELTFANGFVIQTGPPKRPNTAIYTQLNTAQLNLYIPISPTASIFLSGGHNQYHWGTTNNDMGFSQAFVALGDFDQSPIYGFAGLKNLHFSQLKSVSPISQPLSAQFYYQRAPQIGIGYNKSGLDTSVALVSPTPTKNLSQSTPYAPITNNPDSSNAIMSSRSYAQNILFNLNYQNYSPDFNWRAGISAINASPAILEQTKTANHLTNNNSWAFNGELNTDGISFIAAVIQTSNALQSLPGINSTPEKPLSRFRIYQGAISYQYNWLNRPTLLSASYSHASWGERYPGMHQWVLGIEQRWWKNTALGLEYRYNQGLVINNLFNSEATNRSLIASIKTFF